MITSAATPTARQSTNTPTMLTVEFFIRLAATHITRLMIGPTERSIPLMSTIAVWAMAANTRGRAVLIRLPIRAGDRKFGLMKPSTQIITKRTKYMMITDHAWRATPARSSTRRPARRLA